MSLHDEIMALECDESESDQFIIGHIEARHAAAALAIKADAEIARLSVALEAAQNALKEAIQDCREAYDKGRADQAVDDLPGELQIAAMGHDAQRIAGENAVLRDLLRDVLSLIRNIECGCWSPEGTDNLRVRIDWALNGQGRYIPRDGQIYAETSRRADPKAQLGNLLAVIHRDGGQYLAAHGIEKACADAEEAVAKWIMMESSIDALIEQSARAEREACALICKKEGETWSHAPQLRVLCMLLEGKILDRTKQ